MSTMAPPVAKKARLDRAGPLCSKSAAQKLAQQRKSDIVASIRRREEEENMKVPPGWEAVWRDGSAETGTCNSEPQGTMEARFSGHRFSENPRFKEHSSKNLSDHFDL